MDARWSRATEQATIVLFKKLSPHVGICRNPFRCCAPAMREGAVEGQRVGSTKQGKTVLLMQKQIFKIGMLEIDVPHPQLPLIINIHGKGVNKIGFFEKVSHLFDMIGKKEVIVGEVADDFALSLLQGLVTVYLSMPRAFGMVKEADTVIISLKFGDDLTGDRRSAIANDENFDLFFRFGPKQF